MDAWPVRIQSLSLPVWYPAPPLGTKPAESFFMRRRQILLRDSRRIRRVSLDQAASRPANGGRIQSFPVPPRIRHCERIHFFRRIWLVMNVNHLSSCQTWEELSIRSGDLNS